MTHSAQNFKPRSFWQRLLAIFSSGPQWGRPSDPSDDQGKRGNRNDPVDNNEDEDFQDDQGAKERPRDPADRSKPQDGPSLDLDEALRDLSGKLGSIFGGNSNNNGRRGSGGGKPSKQSPQFSGKGLGSGFGAVVVIALLAWVASGFFIVQEGEQSVILRFGRHQETVGAGLHWHLPYPIERHETVATSQLRTVVIGNSNVNNITGLNNASMLTQDKNILDIRFTVQYRIHNLWAYLYNNANTEEAVSLAAESAVREVLGKTPMDVALNLSSCIAIDSPFMQQAFVQRNVATVTDQLPDQNQDTVIVEEELVQSDDQIVNNTALLTSEELIVGRSQCPAGTIRQPLWEPIRYTIQNQMDALGLGIEITAVNASDTGVQVPDKVKHAFDDARSATAEKESLINEGNAYASQRIASAVGVAARLHENALGYQASVEAQAQGDTQRFLQIYEQYRLAPEVTRNRMYLEAMQEIYSNVSKVMLQAQNNSLLYMPLDQLLQINAPGTQTNTHNTTGNTGSVVTPPAVQNAPAVSGTQVTTQQQAARPSEEQNSTRSRGNLGRSRF